MSSILLAAGAVACLGAAARAQQTVYAIGNGGSSLIRFQADNPGNVTVVGDFSGDNTFLDGIDFRPMNGQLYGYLDSTDSFYRVDLNTAALTRVSVGDSAAPTNTFQLGLDFNPTIDRARIITDSDQNIVFNPDTGMVTAATSLLFAIGDQNENADANVIDNAYTNNYPGSILSQQYGIDYGLNALVTIDNNAGTLATVGALGVDTDIYSGFDVYTNIGGINTAYAILNSAADGPGFYTIDLSSGEATLVGSLGFTNQVYSLAVVPIPAPGAGLLMGLASAFVIRRRRGG